MSELVGVGNQFDVLRIIRSDLAGYADHSDAHNPSSIYVRSGTRPIFLRHYWPVHRQGRYCEGEVVLQIISKDNTGRGYHQQCFDIHLSNINI